MSARRLVGRVALALGALLGLLLLAVFALLLVINTRWGSRQVLERALPLAREAIAGDLEVAELHLGLDRVVLLGLRLRDPDGGLVAEIQRVEASFSPVALLRRHVHLPAVSIEGPSVWLVRDERGLNLTRALAARRPAPDTPEQELSRLVISVDRLALAAGRFELRTQPRANERSEHRPAVALAELAVRGRGRHDLGSGELAVELRLTGASQLPTRGPLAISIDGGIHGTAARAAITASLGGSRLAGRLHAVTRGPGVHQTLELSELHLAPEVVAALVPAWRLPRPIGVQGRLKRRGGEVGGDLVVASAGGRIRAEGTFDLRRLRTPGIEVRGENVDLSALWAKAPESELTFTLKARGGGRDLRTLEGEARLHLPSGRLGGRSAGPIRLDVTASRGSYHLRELQAALPGLTVKARGRADGGAVDLTADLQADSLQRAAGALAAGPAPPVAGQGRLTARLHGPWRRPALAATADFPEARYRTHRARGLSLRLQAPDVRRPRLAVANLAIRELATGGRRLQQVRVALHTAPDRSFGASLETRGPQPLALQATGRWSEALDELALQDLRVVYPEASWRTLQPATIRLGEVLAVSGLSLAAGEQRIRLDLLRSGRTLRARGHLEAIDLARLPLLVRKALPAVVGRLDADVDARVGRDGVAGQAAARAHLKAAGRSLGRVEVSLASRPGAPVTADLRLETLGRTGTARLESPLDLGRLLRSPSAVRWRDLPFTATARLDALPIETLARLSGLRTALGGTASLSLDARGTPASPVGALEIAIAGFRGPKIPPTDARLEVRSPDSAAGLTAMLLVSRADRTLAMAQASLDLPAARLGDRAALARAPLRAEARFGPIELQRLVAPVDGDRHGPRVLGGRLQARAQLVGTLGAPELTVSARADRVTLQGVPLGDASLLLAYAGARPRLDLRLVGPGGGYLTLAAESQIELGYARARAGIDLRKLPITARLRAQRYDLTPLSCVSDLVRVVQGQLDADADVRGHLGAPSVHGRVEWKGGRLALAGLGEYRDIHLLLSGDEDRLVLQELVARSERGTARLSASAERQEGGALKLAAEAQLKHFPIRSAGQRIATLTIAPRLSGRASRERLELTAEVDEAELRLTDRPRRQVQSLKRLDDVILFRGDTPLNRAQAKKHAALEKARRELLADEAAGSVPDDGVREGGRGPAVAEVRVKAPDNLWIRGPDINLELGLDPLFVVRAMPDPEISGTVLVRRGQLDVLGRRFRLQDSSSVRFSGPPDRPVLDVRAIHEPRQADVTVVVHIVGPVDGPKVDITSPERPEYTQADLIMVILTGRLPEEAAEPMADTASVTTQAASLLGGFLADRLQNTIMRRLPIDVLNIDPGEGLRALELEAGTYLGDDLYVAYVGRFGSDPFLRENLNEIQLEYRLSQRWSFEAAYGDTRRGSAELVWTKRY